MKIVRIATALALSAIALGELSAGADAAAVNRAGRIKVVVSITMKSDFASPIRCSVDFTHQGAQPNRLFSEEMSRRARVDGRTGRCIVEIPFSWIGADDTQPIFLAVRLHPDQGLAEEVIPENDVAPRANPLAVGRAPIRHEQIPLPANGTTTVLTYEIDM